jgi:hypothetical protein
MQILNIIVIIIKKLQIHEIDYLSTYDILV